MMKIQLSHAFPPGTQVGAYDAEFPAAELPPAGEPAATDKVDEAGYVTFDDLEVDKYYVVAGLVDDKWLQVAFHSGTPAE